MRSSLSRLARKLSLAELGANWQSPGPPLPPVELKPENKTHKTIMARTAADPPANMLEYIVQVMKAYPDAVVITQVGSFYEMYFENAIEYAPKLNLKLARKKQQSPRKEYPFVNMAGFPIPQLERYTKQLVKNYGKTVVLLQQDPNRVFTSQDEAEKRPISRILTPGTLLAESFVDSSRNNYLAAIQFTTAQIHSEKPEPESEVSIAWLDVAAGTIFYQNTTFAALPNDLSRLQPREILIDKGLKKAEKQLDLLDIKQFPVTYHKFVNRDSLALRFSQRFSSTAQSVSRASHQMGPRAAIACGSLLDYLDETIPGGQLRYREPVEYIASDVLQLDARSRGALELFATDMGDSTKGSVYSVIRRTKSISGSRLLAAWLTEPLQDIPKIRRRQDLVAYVLSNSSLAEQLKSCLQGLPDGKRVVQKLSMRKFDPLDLNLYSQAVTAAQRILQLLKANGDSKALDDWINPLEKSLLRPLEVAQDIQAAINVDALIAVPTEEAEGATPSESIDSHETVSTSYAPVLFPDISERLIELYKSQNAFLDRKKEIQQRLANEYPDVSKLTLRWSPQNRYHVHFKHDGPLELAHEKVIARTKRTISIFDEEWQTLGNDRDEFKVRLEREEQRILNQLRNSVLETVEPTREFFGVVDEIDVILSFAELASELRLTRPEIVEEPVLNIVNGRHIMVETGLQLGGSDFVENDCLLTLEQPICMVTGPNMGGKSTYIRQNAIIYLLAHIGSYVPAEKATIGLVDRIFCRVGAGDDLYRGRSTFMMEMLETANILHNATSRSLAILDEVGRGTSGRDGLAIAYATIKHLYERNRCRALFATHFGRDIYNLLETHGSVDSMSCLQADIDIGLSTNFRYRLTPGICSDSKGILTAQLANFPSEALEDAAAVIQ